MAVNSLFIVLWQVVPMGGGREGGHLFEDINPVHTARTAYTQNYDCAGVTKPTKDVGKK